MATRRRLTRLEQLIAQLVRDEAGLDAGPLDRAVIASTVAKAADRVERIEVEAARAAGATWQDVGDAFGFNRQYAHERFRDGPDGGRSRYHRSPAAQSNSDTSSP